MEAVTFQFKLTANDYRNMSYFNTFALRKGQSALVVTAWCGAILLLLLELVGIFTPTDIMHLCFIIIAISVPVMVLSVELNVRRFKRAGEETEKKTRVVSIGDNGVKLSAAKGSGVPAEPWKSFAGAYETKSMFIIYRDMSRTIVIPKAGEAEAQLTTARSYLRLGLGNRFKTRL